jgi:predicted nucleotidyltransferase component of viral defense system
MNNIVANFDQVLKFAQEYGLPSSKKRGILHEYLQTKILEMLYRKKLMKNIFFIGGTCMRLLYGLDRFSEDLDFDIEKTKLAEIDKLMQQLTEELRRENLKIDFSKKVSGRRRYYELRFKELLYELEIGAQETEKLKIKFDFESIWHAHQREVAFLNRYGFLTNVVSIPLSQLLVQKLTAYTERQQTQPRDIYDIVWLISQGANIDHEFLKKNELQKDLLSRAEIKFVLEKSKLSNYKKRLKPFLITERNIDKLDFFPQMLSKLKV